MFKPDQQANKKEQEGLHWPEAIEEFYQRESERLSDKDNPEYFEQFIKDCELTPAGLEKMKAGEARERFGGLFAMANVLYRRGVKFDREVSLEDQLKLKELIEKVRKSYMDETGILTKVSFNWLEFDFSQTEKAETKKIEGFGKFYTDHKVYVEFPLEWPPIEEIEKIINGIMATARTSKGVHAVKTHTNPLAMSKRRESIIIYTKDEESRSKLIEKLENLSPYCLFATSEDCRFLPENDSDQNNFSASGNMITAFRHAIELAAKHDLLGGDQVYNMPRKIALRLGGAFAFSEQLRNSDLINIVA